MMAALRDVMDTMQTEPPEIDEDLGAGVGFGKLVLILTGVSALMACLLTLLYVHIQLQSACHNRH